MAFGGLLLQYEHSETITFLGRLRFVINIFTLYHRSIL